MLRALNKPIMLMVIVLNVVMPNIVALITHTRLIRVKKCVKMNLRLQINIATADAVDVPEGP
jgi:hypothetical protein